MHGKPSDILKIPSFHRKKAFSSLESRGALAVLDLHGLIALSPSAVRNIWLHLYKPLCQSVDLSDSEMLRGTSVCCFPQASDSLCFDPLLVSSSNQRAF